MLTVISLMLVLCLGVFAACGEEKKPTASDNSTDPSTENETPAPEVTPGGDEGKTEPPADPDAPAEPSTPTEPEKPAEPSTPTEPEKPAEPSTPTEPEKPAEPSTPTEPEKPHVHSWDEGTVSRAASCKEEGIRVQTCACGETKLSPIAMLTEHSYDKGVTANGIKTFTCTVCGNKKTEAVAGDHTHDWQNPVETKTATCKEAGEVTFSCACGEKFSFPTTTPGKHNYTTVNGKSVCSVCGEEEPQYSSPSDIQ